MRLALRVLLPIALAGVLAIPATSPAARDAEVAIMDDDVLLRSSPEQVGQTMALFVGMGVERVRISAYWHQIAPRPRSQTAPAGFDGASPTSKGYRWTRLDAVAYYAREHGIKLLISISTPAPYWATANPKRKNPVWKPDPDEFAKFAHAVAQRYRDYADQFAILNEPNQGAWLQPQSDSKGLYSPHLYRSIVRRAYPQIREIAPDSKVLIGELAPSGVRESQGGATRPVKPLTFLRAFGCINRRLKPTSKGRCRVFAPAPGDAIGHHPYNFFAPPTARSLSRDDAAIGDTPRLMKVLDALTKQGRIASPAGAKLDVYFTEFGYQTDPPDPVSGISPDRQARWLAQAAYETWRRPRIRSLTQFQLIDGALRRDHKGRERYAGFQSGLWYENLEPKPAFTTFGDPIWASTLRPRRGKRFTLWGQVRPGTENEVTIQFRSSRRRLWRTIENTKTDIHGYFTLRMNARRGEFRFLYDNGLISGRSNPLRISPR